MNNLTNSTNDNISINKYKQTDLWPCLNWVISSILCPVLLTIASIIYNTSPSTKQQQHSVEQLASLMFGLAKISFFFILLLVRLLSFHHRYGIYPSLQNSGLCQILNSDYQAQDYKKRPRYNLIFLLMFLGVLLFLYHFAVFLLFIPIRRDDADHPLIYSAFLVGLIGLHVFLQLTKFEQYQLTQLIGLAVLAISIVMSTNAWSLTESFRQPVLEVLRWCGIGLACFIGFAISVVLIKKWQKQFQLHYSVSVGIILLVDGVLRTFYYGIQVGINGGDQLANLGQQSTIGLCLKFVAIGFIECIALILLLNAAVKSLISSALNLASLVPVLLIAVKFIQQPKTPKASVIIGIIGTLIGTIITIVGTYLILRKKAKIDFIESQLSQRILSDRDENFQQEQFCDGIRLGINNQQNSMGSFVSFSKLHDENQTL